MIQNDWLTHESCEKIQTFLIERIVSRGFTSKLQTEDSKKANLRLFESSIFELLNLRLLQRRLWEPCL